MIGVVGHFPVIQIADVVVTVGSLAVAGRLQIILLLLLSELLP